MGRRPATGQELRVGEETARLVPDVVVEHGALFREYGGFADELPVDDGTRTFERALRLSGREPDWRPLTGPSWPLWPLSATRRPPGRRGPPGPCR